MWVVGDGNFIARHNLIAAYPSGSTAGQPGKVTISGSLEMTQGGITGSLNGTASRAITASFAETAKAVVAIGDSAPVAANFTTGSLWFNSNDLTLNVRYQDVDGGQWVGVTTAGPVPNQAGVYNLPNTTTNTWVLLGTFNAPQTGATLYTRIVAHAGFNASTAQNQVTELYFKTSNGTSFQAGAAGGNFLGDGLAYRNTSLGPQTSVPESFRIVQVSTTQYQVYGFFNAAFIDNSTYQIQIPPNTTWINSSTVVGAPTGTYINITPSAGKGYAFLTQAAANTTTDSAFTWNVSSANGITVSGGNITLVNPGTYNLLASLQLRSTYAVYQWTNSSGVYLPGTADGVAAAVNSSDSAVPQPAMGIITTTAPNTVIQLRLRGNLGLTTNFQTGAPAQIIQIA
jgi:hypothetical protein